MNLHSSAFPESTATTPEPLFVMKGDMTCVHCILSANFVGERYLCVGTSDGMVHLWNLQSNRRIKTLKPSDNPCLSLHLVGDHLITQDKSGLVQLWIRSNEDFICLYSRNFNNLSFCKLSVLKKDLIYLAIPREESKISVYFVKNNSLEFFRNLECLELEGQKLGDVLVLKMISVRDQILVASVYESGILVLWDNSSKNTTTHHQLTYDTPMCFDFDSENLQGVCGTSGNCLIVFKLATEDLRIAKKKQIMITNPGTASLCIRPDKKILAAGCWDGKIRIFSWKNLKLLAVLDCHQESVLDVCFFADNSDVDGTRYFLAGGSSDKKVSLWNIYN